MFIEKSSFVAESHIRGHFINDAHTARHLDPFEITGNVCRGSPIKIVIFPRKNLSSLVTSFSIILPSAIILFVCVIKASPHIINFDSFSSFPNLVFNFTLHVDVLNIGIRGPKKLCAVLPPFNNIAATPDDAAAIHLCPVHLTCASIPLSRYVLLHPP